jgi:hypothetical protein
MDVHHAHVLVNSSTTSDKPGGAIDAQLVGIPAADPVASPAALSNNNLCLLPSFLRAEVLTLRR